MLMWSVQILTQNLNRIQNQISSVFSQIVISIAPFFNASYVMTWNMFKKLFKNTLNSSIKTKGSNDIYKPRLKKLLIYFLL